MDKEQIIEILHRFAELPWRKHIIEQAANEILALFVKEATPVLGYEPIDYAGIDPVKWGEVKEAWTERLEANGWVWFEADWEEKQMKSWHTAYDWKKLNKKKGTLYTGADSRDGVETIILAFEEEKTGGVFVVGEKIKPLACPEELKEAYKAIREVREALLKLERSFCHCDRTADEAKKSKP